MSTDEVALGCELRDKGIKRAVDHADAVAPSWSQQAYAFLLEYMKSNPTFQTTDLRYAARGKIPDPPDDRAWGGILRRARTAGLLKCDGYRPVLSAMSHRRPMPVWRVL